MSSERKDFLSASRMTPARLDERENGVHNEGGFIDEQQLLTKLPISRRTLGNWKAKGILPYIKIGRRKPSSRNAACR